MTSTGLKPVWAGQELRLDPFRLPQAVTYATRDAQGDVTFAIDHRGVVVRRMLEKSGLPAIIHLKVDPDGISPAATLSGIRDKALSAGKN